MDASGFKSLWALCGEDSGSWHLRAGHAAERLPTIQISTLSDDATDDQKEGFGLSLAGICPASAKPASTYAMP